MKHYINLLLVFLVVSVKAQALQLKEFKYEAIYNFISVPDSLKQDSIEQKMALYINNDESLYQNLYKKSIDSMTQQKTITGDISYIDLNKIKIPKSTISIYKKYDENKIIFTDRIGTSNIGYNDNFNDLNWQITNEKKKMTGYNATKAIVKFRGRQYTTWFTDEIPFQDGPYKFSKLPGLILELYDSKKYFHFLLLSFKKAENSVYYNSKFIDIDRQKYYQKKIDYHNSLLANPVHKGKIKKIDVYNPIELK